MEKTQNFTVGQIFAPLMRFALPVLLALFLQTLCAFGVRMPITWLMSKQIPVSLFHIGLAIPVSTIVQIALFGIYFSLLLRREKHFRPQKGLSLAP